MLHFEICTVINWWKAIYSFIDPIIFKRYACVILLKEQAYL